MAPTTLKTNYQIMNRVIGFLAVLVVLSSSALAASAAISCPKVNMELAPCLPFIKSNSVAQPSQACCVGAKNIGGDAKSKGDRQAICECIKKVVASAGPYDKNRIPLIPQKCGVSISLPPIDSATDCARAVTDYMF